MTPIPFNRPIVLESGYRHLRQAAENMHISGDGPFTRRCHALLEGLLGAPRALLTTSCTHALEMAALLLDIGPDDEVILPSFTFVSTVNAFALRGARPVFCDIRPDTLNLDEALLPGLLTPRTKAVVPVHYAGVGCEMDAILAIASEAGVSVVEDNAHGLLGKYRGRPLGGLGRLATQSFHETKNFSCGEGGALVLNDPSLVQRAEILREKGTDRSRFFRGEVDKYTWVDLGSSYLPSDLLAALLLSVLEAREQIQARRKQLWQAYRDGLAGWAEENGVRLPHVPAHCEQPYHLFYLILPSLEQRQAFIAHMKQAQIHAVFHYVPLHKSEMGRRLAGAARCPVTERLSDRLVRLPFYPDLADHEQQRVIARATAFRAGQTVVSPAVDDVRRVA